MSNVNYTHDNATAPGIALAHTIHGSPVTGQTPVMGVGENVARATDTVFSNYKKPPRRSKDNGKDLCQAEGCRAYPSKGLGYCIGHARSLGLVENWNVKGRNHESD